MSDIQEVPSDPAETPTPLEPAVPQGTTEAVAAPVETPPVAVTQSAPKFKYAYQRLNWEKHVTRTKV